MTTKHTPGPWVINRLSSKESKGIAIDVERNDHALIEICEVWGTKNIDVINEEAIANANLICSAPDMYDALYLIIRRLSVDIEDGSRPDKWSMEALVLKAQAAINKAKGK